MFSVLVFKCLEFTVSKCGLFHRAAEGSDRADAVGLDGQLVAGEGFQCV